MMLIILYLPDLDDETLTRAKITTVVRAVAKCSNAAELLNTPENLEKIEKMELELERLMEGLGAQVSKKKKQTKKTPAPRKSSSFILLSRRPPDSFF